MTSLPKLKELVKAFVNDCYNFLDKYSDEFTKNSINKVLEHVKQSDEVHRKVYVLYCSIFPFDPQNEGNLNIIFFYKKYIYVVYNYLSETKNDNRISTINDCCNTYIALYGFYYNYNAALPKNLSEFLCDKYSCFLTLMNKNGILEKLKRYYENNISSLINFKNSDKYIKKLLKNFRTNNSIQIIYIDKVIVELQNKLNNNNIINLTNQYNYNLWRKISNTILKNIFVILYKKNFRFSKNFLILYFMN